MLTISWVLLRNRPSGHPEAAKRTALDLNPMRPVIVKLGGSAITNKSKKCSPNLPVIQASIDQIARFRGRLILLHGGGSFAHPFVVKAGLQNGYNDRSQLRAIAETEMFLDQLTRIIGVGLLSNNRPFVPLRPMGFMILGNRRISRSFLEPISQALRLGLMPVIHGDLVFDTRLGCAVLSGDELASFLGKTLNARRVLFGCDVDGVYSRDPKSSSQAVMVEEITKSNYKSVLRSLRDEKDRDATGGMLRKVAEAVELARNGVESLIFNLGRSQLLGDALRGQRVDGTRFVPWRVRD